MEIDIEEIKIESGAYDQTPKTSKKSETNKI